MKARLTREKAIDISIELWEWLAETGGGEVDKENWPGWDTYGKMDLSCALCEYDATRRDYCDSCPYAKRYGPCGHGVLGNWVNARTKRTRRKYAAIGVEQLKALKRVKK